MGASLTAETRRRGGGERGAGFGTLGLGTRASVWCAKFEWYRKPLLASLTHVHTSLSSPSSLTVSATIERGMPKRSTIWAMSAARPLT